MTLFNVFQVFIILLGCLCLGYILLALFYPGWRPFHMMVKAYTGFRYLIKSESFIAWSAKVDQLGILGKYVYEGNFSLVTGYPQEHFKNLPDDYEKLIVSEDLSHRRMAIAEMLTGERDRWEGEYRIKSFSGETQWIREIITRYNDSRMNLWLGGIIMLNTAMHRRSRQLSRSEGFLHAVINALQQPLFIKNEDLKYVLVNKAFCQLMGKSEEELIGMSDDQLFEEEEARQFRQSDASVLERKTDLYETEVKLGEKSAYYYIIKSLYTDREDKSRYIIGVMTDLTVRRQQDEELKKALERAEEAVRSKSMFLASMSHEIRTPMNSLLGMVELLSETSLNEEQRESLEVINQAGVTLLSIINDILDLSKLEAGRIKLASSPFKLGELIDEVLAMLQFRANEKRLELSSEIDDSLRVMQLAGDSDRIRQVLLNLINNALKFTQEGEVKIEAKVLDLQTSRMSFIVKVIDTGIGIPEGDKSKVFEAFSQSKLTEGAAIEGTGLGLTITKNLVELMGGTIGFDSVEGVGSTFWFKLSLPIVRPGMSPSGKIMVRMPRVLVVEDNPTNLQLVSSYIQKLGITQWDVAYNGKDAVDLVSGNLYDLILMDIQMPVMDGIEATRQIRRIEKERPLMPSARILAMTAYSPSAEKQKFIQKGMDGMLRKPFLFDDLRVEVERILGNNFFVQIENNTDE
ncbi:MAG: response regulator [Bacteroidales bacterium]|jgi:PAS domain S-box-containing protein|nr:response regulator [Bacteroidales bacterium]